MKKTTSPKKKPKQTTQLQNGKATQANTLIRAKYNFKPRENLFARLLISKLNPREEVGTYDPKKRRIWFTMEEIMGYLQPNPKKKYGSLYADIQEIIHGLNNKPIEIITDDEQMTIYWIGSHGYVPEKKSYWFKLTEDIEPFLLHLKGNFSTFPLFIYQRLRRSSHLMRLFEVLYSYRNMRGGAVVYDHWEDLRDQIGAPYKQYGHFKDRVLKKALKELPEKTPIRFEYEEIKKTGSRKIEGLAFRVYIHKPFQMPETQQGQQAKLFDELGFLTDAEQQLLEDILNSLRRWGIDESIIWQIVENPFTFIETVEVRQVVQTEYSRFEYIWNKIQYTLSVPNIAKSAAAYFMSALKNNYQSEALSKSLKNAKASVKRKKLEQALNQIEDERASLNQKYSDLTHQVMEGIFESIPELKQNIFAQVKRNAPNWFNDNLSAEEQFDKRQMFYAQVVQAIKKQHPDSFELIENEWKNQREILHQKELDLIAPKTT